MDEVFRNLSNNGIGDGAARKFSLLIYSRSKILDEFGRAARLYFDDAGSASEVIVYRNARYRFNERIIEISLVPIS